MRKLRYSVAMSLDGFIAGPKGEFDWIPADPEVDFAAMWSQFDTLLMGRHSYELVAPRMDDPAFRNVTTIVFSRTLRPNEHPKVTVIPEVRGEYVQSLKERSGKDIWLFGGGSLFRSVLDLDLVDRVEVSVLPVLLGAGIPLIAGPYLPTKLKLLSEKSFRSGRVALVYEVQR